MNRPGFELTLVRRYKRFHLYAAQIQHCSSGLDACTAPDIGEAWMRMRTLECGLNQEAYPEDLSCEVCVRRGT